MFTESKLNGTQAGNTGLRICHVCTAASSCIACVNSFFLKLIWPWRSAVRFKVEQQHDFVILHLVFVRQLMTNLFTAIKCTYTKLKIKTITDQNSFAFLALLNRTITTTARIFYSTWSLPLTRYKIHHINITLVTHCLICKKITICVSMENTKKYDTFSY